LSAALCFGQVLWIESGFKLGHKRKDLVGCDLYHESAATGAAAPTIDRRAGALHSRNDRLEFAVEKSDACPRDSAAQPRCSTMEVECALDDGASPGMHIDQPALVDVG
jgi:hypothetical protein